MVAIINETKDANGISTHRLAQAVEDRVSRSQLYDILKGARTMDLAELDALCDALGVPLGDVVSEAYRRASVTSESDPGRTA